VPSGVTLYQGAPGSKFSKAPLVEVLKARVEHCICTSFLGGPGHVHPENFWIYTLWNAISWTLGRDFTEFWWSENDIVTYQRPWPMFLLYRLNLGAPIWPIEVGGPRVLPVWAHSSYATGGAQYGKFVLRGGDIGLSILMLVVQTRPSCYCEFRKNLLSFRCSTILFRMILLCLMPDNFTKILFYANDEINLIGINSHKNGSK
jgi:hypothetical protein